MSMSPEAFCYWLQGYFELNQAKHGGYLPSVSLTPQQVMTIQDHLDLVFNKVTPQIHSIPQATHLGGVVDIRTLNLTEIDNGGDPKKIGGFLFFDPNCNKFKHVSCISC